MTKTDYTTLPPSERPAIGEPVKIQNSSLTGIVTDYKDKRREMKNRQILVKISAGVNSYRIQIHRSALLDMNGDPMPDYLTPGEERIMEEQKQEYIEQYQRLEQSMSERGYELEDYLRFNIGEYTTEIHSGDIARLKSGEERIERYFDENICEELGFGLDWVLYEDENCKLHPCGSQMKEYLNCHPERREMVWQWMAEDGYEVKDVYEEYRERDARREEMDEWFLMENDDF
ncbi:MAG: hypothetical protein LUG27_02945 [Clostridiales bacterium]|nr:hypothetical protein [Clostridiales bacterium]